MTSNYDIFVNYKRKSVPIVNFWSCSDGVCLRSSFGVPLILLWISYKTLKWIRSAFFEEPSGRSTSGRLFPKGLKKAKREEDSKIMRSYMLLTNIGVLAYEVDMFGGLLLHRVCN